MCAGYFLAVQVHPSPTSIYWPGSTTRCPPLGCRPGDEWLSCEVIHMDRLFYWDRILGVLFWFSSLTSDTTEHNIFCWYCDDRSCHARSYYNLVQRVSWNFGWSKHIALTTAQWWSRSTKSPRIGDQADHCSSQLCPEWCSQARFVVANKEQDHLRMNVASDQTIILGLQIF